MKRILASSGAVLASFVLLLAFGAAFGHPAGQILSTLFDGSIGSRFAIEGSLIKSVPQRYFGEIEARTLEALRNGERAEDIAADYVSRYGVSESRALLIARDQIGKLNGQLNRARQDALGVKRFTWRTVGDERVRDEHDELDGKVFDWDDPPGEGFPGDPINCRCGAEPILSDVYEALQ